MSRRAAYRVWQLTCPGEAQEVGRVRRWTRDVLCGYPCADEAELIASELSTNAITHTLSGQEYGLFTVMLTWTPGIVVMAVTDNGGATGIPCARQANDDATTGRGLALVEAFSHGMDIISTSTGRTVRVVLHYDEKEPAHQRQRLPQHPRGALQPTGQMGDHVGLDPAREARVAAMVEEARPVWESTGNADALQQYLKDHNCMEEPS
jgi:anti-sigma regulatory factor (Ser/Thr protein kinase)